MSPQKLRIVCISDTHNASPGQGYTLPKGDILIHAGDLTNNGQPSEIRRAIAWIREADYEHKVVVAGNHDCCLDSALSSRADQPIEREQDEVEDEEAAQLRRMLREDDSITYLEHESRVATVKGVEIKVFGSPWSPASSSPSASPTSSSNQHAAFQYPPSQAQQLWSNIPSDTTLLITHTPPAGHLDNSAHWTHGGCPALSQALLRTKPRLHVCGHCHKGRGAHVVSWSDEAEVEAEHGVTEWIDPGAGNKKQSFFGLTAEKKERRAVAPTAAAADADDDDDVAKETAIVNASIMAKSHGRGAKAFNKPIVVDIELP